MCGADTWLDSDDAMIAGSPPRVRSRHGVGADGGASAGITSACAEQTNADANGQLADRDHLRVCGADGVSKMSACTSSGSPPRVRSRLPPRYPPRYRYRITSACAEQTLAPPLVLSRARDHLRVCGADSCILLCSEPAEWRGIFDLRTA